MFTKLKISHSDGSEIEAPGRKSDVVRFERHFKIPAASIFGDDGLYTEHLWFFGYLAESRVVENIAPFDDWLDTVEGVSVVPGDDDENPTDPDSSPSL